MVLGPVHPYPVVVVCMRIQDSRALMGATSLILAGAISTIMLSLYFTGDYTASGSMRSRWLWEIMMNLQVLALALMWFCYVDRVSESTGHRKTIMRIRQFFSLTIILVPFFIIVISAALDWFMKPAPIEIISLLILLSILSWITSLTLQRRISRRARPQKKNSKTLWERVKPRAWYSMLPVGVLLVLCGGEYIYGGNKHYIYAPILLYSQAAIPFLESSFGIRKPQDTVS